MVSYSTPDHLLTVMSVFSHAYGSTTYSHIKCHGLSLCTGFCLISSTTCGVTVHSLLHFLISFFVHFYLLSLISPERPIRSSSIAHSSQQYQYTYSHVRYKFLLRHLALTQVPYYIHSHYTSSGDLCFHGLVLLYLSFVVTLFGMPGQCAFARTCYT